MKPVSISIAIITAAIIIGLGLLIGLAYPKNSDYITVGGQAESIVKPDSAVVYFAILTRADTADATQNADAATTQKVQTALQAISVRGIETQNYYLNPRTEWTNDGPVDKGYELSHTLKVTTDIEDVSSALSAGVGAGVTSVDRIEYIFSRAAQDAAVTDAMRKATVAARVKAELVASSIGADAGRPLKVDEGGWWMTPSNEPSSEADALPDEYKGNVIMPQRMAVQANVNAVFAVD